MDSWLLYMMESGDDESHGCWPMTKALPNSLRVSQPSDSESVPGWFGECPYVARVGNRPWHVRYRSTDIPAMLQWLYEHGLCSEFDRDRWLLDYTLTLTSGQ